MADYLYVLRAIFRLTVLHCVYTSTGAVTSDRTHCHGWSQMDRKVIGEWQMSAMPCFYTSSYFVMQKRQCPSPVALNGKDKSTVISAKSAILKLGEAKNTTDAIVPTLVLFNNAEPVLFYNMFIFLNGSCVTDIWILNEMQRLVVADSPVYVTF